MTFARAMMGLRRWLIEHSILKGDDRIKITIEASTPEMAHVLLCTLKQELEPSQWHGNFDVDLDRPVRFMGLDVEFKLKQPQPIRTLASGRAVPW